MKTQAEIKSSDSPSEISQNNFVFSEKFYLPMLPIVCALALAFGVCGSFEFLREWKLSFFFIGVAFWAASFWMRFSFEKWRFFGKSSLGISESKFLKFSQIAFPFMAVFFCALAYYFFRVPPNPIPQASVAEVSLKMQICEISSGANNSKHGIAKILNAKPKNFSALEGSKIWFSISADKKSGENRELEVTQKIFAQGILYPSDFEIEYPLPKNFEKAEEKIKLQEKSRAFGDYLKLLKIHFKFSAAAEDVEEVEAAGISSKFFSQALSYMKNSMKAFPFEGMENSTAAKIYRAMILGDKSELSADQKDDFMRTGTMHVFAISGMHVGFAAAVLFFIPFCLRLNKNFSAMFVLPVLFIYVCACGARPSAMRAFCMIAFVWLAVLLVRGLGVYAALLLSAAIALVYNPTLICDAGFVLSYGVVFSILVYGVPLYGFILSKIIFFKSVPFQYLSIWERALLAFQKFMTASICIGFAAALASAPLTSYFFGYFAPASPIYSPLFSFGAACAVGLGFIGFMLPNFIAQFFNFIASGIVWMMSESARLGATHFDTAIDFKIQNGFLSAAIFLIFATMSACIKKPLFKIALPPIFVAVSLAAAVFYS